MRTRLWIWFCFLACLVAINARHAAAAEPAANEQFAALLHDAWEFRLREDPLFATETGDHRYDDKLPKVSLADEKRRNAAQREFLARLRKIDRESLSAANRVNYDIFARVLRENIQEHAFQTYLMPISDRWGFHIDFPELPRNMPLTTTRDYENYIARLRGFSDYATGHMELMREGVRKLMTVPSVIMQRYNEPLEAQIVEDPEKSLLYGPFQKLPPSMAKKDRERLQSAARKAIAESVVPGYRKFLKFMKEEYVPNCRGTIAASALPNGRDYYRFCVAKYTTLDDRTPEQIHAIGKEEVARIRGEMDAIIKDLKFDGDFAKFTDNLRTNPKFYAKSAEELQKEVSFILKRIDGQLPTLFGRLPRMPYGVRQVPDYIAPQTMFAYYQGPTGDGRRAGFFYINTYNLPSRPTYMLEALSLHEAVPGPQLQIALQQELADLPEFRKYSNFTAFIEGWGLYSERLGLEAGFYKDPYSNFGRLTMEIWRACRLVVDTGIHHLGWTREQAIEYMRANSAMPLHDIRSEVDRYIGWPGQALAYKTGEMKIRQLRKEAESQLGEKFDVRAFHDVVLGGGAVPLGVLEKNVQAWIADSKSKSAKRAD
jgi:uncharacterized protein (DUF885 family)